MTELPKAFIEYLYYFYFGEREVKEQLKRRLKTFHTNIPEDEYAITFHNHSCDGKKQRIEDILREAASKGAMIVGITDHNSDEAFRQQIGDKILKQYNFNGRIVYALRGVEYRCISEENGKLVDMVFIGCKDRIPPRMHLNPALEFAHRNKALIGVTSPLNEPFFGPNRIQLKRFLKGRKADYVEVLNSSKPFPFLYNDILAEIILQEYNHYAGPNEKIAGIWVSDSHTKKSVMDASFGVKKGDFKFLENETAEQNEACPERLIEGIRSAFRRNAVTNYGGYPRFFELLFDADNIESFRKQMAETWKDYLNFRFSKNRRRGTG